MNFYGCMTVSYQLRLCIRRCGGPERHEMLTVFNAYYGYCEILQFVRFCTNLALI